MKIHKADEIESVPSKCAPEMSFMNYNEWRKAIQ